jgi:hypothetical protein
MRESVVKESAPTTGLLGSSRLVWLYLHVGMLGVEQILTPEAQIAVILADSAGADVSATWSRIQAQVPDGHMHTAL